jgi:hypothetical protein
MCVVTLAYDESETFNPQNSKDLFHPTQSTPNMSRFGRNFLFVILKHLTSLDLPLAFHEGHSNFLLCVKASRIYI